MDNSYKYGILFDYCNDSRSDSNYGEIEGVLKSDQKQLLCYGEKEDFYLSDNGLEVYEEFSKKIQEKISKDFNKLVELDILYPFSKTELLDFFHKLEHKESIKDIALLRYYLFKQNSNYSHSFSLRDYLYGLKEHLRRKNSFIYKIYKRIK